VGPDLTGSQRSNLDYNLENLLDPSALVGRDYQMTVLHLRDGRLITGIIQREDRHTLTIQTANDTVIAGRTEVRSRSQSPISLMPEGLLEKLTDEEVRDLIAYLASPEQVPLPAAP